ncbi:MAG: hypothetical protein R6T96_09400 [Longimicrobiales bacterium]
MAPRRLSSVPIFRTGSFALALTAMAILTSCSDAPLDPAGNPATAPAPEASFALAQTDDYMPGQVLVKFQPGANAQEIMKGVGAQLEREISLGIRLLRVPDQAVEAVVAALSNNPNVEFAEPNYIRTFGNPSVMPVNDPYIGYKWDLDNDGYLLQHRWCPRRNRSRRRRHGLAGGGGVPGDRERFREDRHHGHGDPGRP